MQYLKSEKRYSHLTIQAYQTDIGQFANSLGLLSIKEDLTKADAGDIRAWLVHLISEGYSPVTLNRKIASLKSFYRFLQKRRGLTKSPIAGVVAMKTSRRLPEFVEQKGMDLLLRALEFSDDFAGWRDRCILELLYGTGIRRAELIQLKDSDIDWSNHHLRVLGKGSKERLIPLIPALEAFIQQYLTVRDNEFPDSRVGTLVVSNTGKKAYPGLIQTTVKRYLSGISTLSRKSPHILRHTFATHLSNCGAPLNAIKELMGHSSLAATQVYMHNSIARLQEIYRQAHPKAEEEHTP